MIVAVAGVPVETVALVALVALVVGLAVGVEVARPWRPPMSGLRRRQLDRLIDDHEVRS